jgi:hypothetical protein
VTVQALRPAHKAPRENVRRLWLRVQLESGLWSDHGNHGADNAFSTRLRGANPGSQVFDGRRLIARITECAHFANGSGRMQAATSL